MKRRNLSLSRRAALQGIGAVGLSFSLPKSLKAQGSTVNFYNWDTYIGETTLSYFTAATWIEPDGATEAFPDGALRMTPLAETMVAGREVPTEWRVELPDRGLDVTIEALNPGSWMDVSVSYWEGPVSVRGSHAGRGYLEMTGYD